MRIRVRDIGLRSPLPMSLWIYKDLRASLTVYLSHPNTKNIQYKVFLPKSFK